MEAVSPVVTSISHDFWFRQIAEIGKIDKPDYSQTLEEMLEGIKYDYRITDEHFGQSLRHRTVYDPTDGLYVLMPVIDDNGMSEKGILRLIAKKGFVPEELPWLIRLHGVATDFWWQSRHLDNVHALGDHSIWTDQHNCRYAVYLNTQPQDRQENAAKYHANIFKLRELEPGHQIFVEGDCFLVRQARPSKVRRFLNTFRNYPFYLPATK